jgi:hypothetical protein
VTAAPRSPGTSPGIDHLVLAVRDLDRAMVAFAAMGFTLTPRAFHPFGTANHLAILDGNFVELLGVADPSKIPEHAPDGFSFAAWNRDFLARREGVSMLVLDSADPAADHARFRAAGLTSCPPMTFARGAVQPDGSKETVSFTIAFAIGPAVPSLPSFVCRQHAPEHFWKPEFQAHANGAQAIETVTVAADDIGPAADYYAALLGPGAVARDGDRAVARTARGTIELLPRAALADRLGAAAPTELPADEPAFLGFRIGVARLDRARAALAAGGVRFDEADGVLRVAAAGACGAVVEFAERGGG